MASSTKKRAQALKDAQKRLAEAQGAYQALAQQMQALNQQGIEQEKIILGILGEIKALEALHGE